MRKARIESIGAYYPDQIVSTEEIIDRMPRQPVFDFKRLTGINHRRWKSDDEDSLSMAIRAAEECLRNSQYSAVDMDVIINGSISKIHDGKHGTFEPPMSLSILRSIGAEGAFYFDVGSACAGMNSGIYILNSMIRSGAVKRGMVVSGEATSPGVEVAVKEIDSPIDDQFATLTMGDAAAAVILDEAINDDEGIDFIDFLTLAHYSDLCIALPSTANPGWTMHTKTQEMQSRDLIDVWPRFLEDLLSKKGRSFSPADYDFFITHQVSMAAIYAYIKSGEDYFQTKLPPTLTSVEEFGNTASTTHWVVIYNGLRSGKIKNGARILLGSSASGITIGFLAFTLGDLEV